SLPPGQRTRIVDILAASPQEPAGASLIKALGDELAPAVADRIAEHFRIFLPGKWRGLRQSSELTQAVRPLPAPPAGRSVALALVGAAERADFCGQVAAIVRDIREPDAIRVTAIRTLGLLPCESAILTLAALSRDGKQPLGLRQEALLALGHHAEGKGDFAKAALRALQEALTKKACPKVEREESLRALAAGRPGSIWLLETQAKGQLPGDLLAEASRLLRNSPYQDLRNRALVAFPTSKRLDPGALPRVESLLDRKGNPAKGEQLVRNSVHSELQCLKCHTIQ